MNNIILEMRQSNSSHVIANGDYTVDLAKEVIIENGDTINLKQSFIDITNNDQIVIPYDLTLSTQHILYYTDWIYDANAKGNYVNNTGSAGLQAQGFSFVPYDVEVGAPIAGYSLYVGAKYDNISGTGNTSREFVAEYKYVNLQGNEQYFTSSNTVPPMEYGLVSSYTDAFSIIAKTGTFELFSPTPQALENTYGVKFDTFNEETASENTYTPFLFECSFTLPAGSYDPLDLSLIISESMSKNGVSETNHSSALIQSPFLKTASQFSKDAPYPNSTSPNPPTIPYVPVWITVLDGQLAQRMTFILENSQYFIGSNQIALEYNAQTQKFNFTYLHFPYYDNVAGNQISVLYLPVYGNKTAAIGRNGGIAFTQLNAVIKETGKPFDFWSGSLGFNLDNILLKPQTYNGLFAGLNGEFTYYNIVDGVNTTNGFVGVDSAIVKQKDKWFTLQSTKDVLNSTIDTTVNIIAEKSLNEILNKFSHFLVSCDLKFTNDYIGTDNFLSIQGVVNKYMSYGAYLYAADDGSIMYQHMGAPIVLKSVRCRILNSDKKTDKILGPDNTLIFQITKQYQPAPPEDAKA